MKQGMMRNWLKHPPKRIVTLLGSWVGSLGMMLPSPVGAVEDAAVLLLLEPIDMNQVIRYWQGEVPGDGSVITERTISQTNLTPPSLWWAQEQFGDNLLNFWVAYPGVNGELRRVDLIINRQTWLGSTYLDRYAFLHHFGTAASDFGYQTRIYDWQGDLLGVYVCQFEPAQPLSPPAAPPTASDCRVFLDTFGLGIFASPIPNGVVEPIPPGIGQ
jgi:hypothetical protein